MYAIFFAHVKRYLIFFLHLPNEFKIELCFCNPPDFKSMCHHRLELVWKKPWTKFPTLQFISYDRFWSLQTHSIEIDEKKTHTQQIHETNRKTTEIRFESNIDNELKCYAYLVILNSRFARKIKFLFKLYRERPFKSRIHVFH